MNKLLVVTMETDGINIESSPNMDIDVSLMATGGQKFQNSIYNNILYLSIRYPVSFDTVVNTN